MADRYKKDASNCLRMSKSASSSLDLQLYIHGLPFHLDKELLAARSAKVAELLEKNAIKDLHYLLRDIQFDPETFELIARFCYGYEVQLSSENIIPVFCAAYYLVMDENHSTDNLLKRAATFLEQRVIPSWNETINALRASENALKLAVDLGLIDAFLDSLVEKAVNDPRLLGEPIKISRNNDETEEEEDGDDDPHDAYRPNARRRLFVLDWKSEDLTTLSLQLYEPIVHAMNRRNVPSEYVVSSICKYAKKWAFEEFLGEENVPGYKKNYQRDVIEAVERLLPHERGLISCSFLFESLKHSVLLEASSDCQNGFEVRIGKQLEQARVQDLLIQSQGYSKEAKYDVDSVRRILKIFYSNNFERSDISVFVKVAKLIEEFLAEVASDPDLKISTFVSIAEMSVAASTAILTYSDGIYRGIDIFLEKHKHLTESERLKVCQILDCQKLSPEACEHAARNERLPLRIVVQVLFVSQLQIRDTVTKEIKGLEEKSRKDGEEEENDEDDHEEVKLEIEKMNNKVVELEKECYLMKREIEKGCVVHRGKKKGKVSVWGEVKRKFGCMTGVHECNCQVKKKKKVHPK